MVLPVLTHGLEGILLCLASASCFMPSDHSNTYWEPIAWWEIRLPDGARTWWKDFVALNILKQGDIQIPLLAWDKMSLFKGISRFLNQSMAHHGCGLRTAYGSDPDPCAAHALSCTAALRPLPSTCLVMNDLLCITKGCAGGRGELPLTFLSCCLQVPAQNNLERSQKCK